MDERLLQAAIDLALHAVASGELPYASLLADPDGTILARDHNTTISSGDITAHPELKLARHAALVYPPEQRALITMYTSCQPCAMCAEVIARSELGRVVYALSSRELNSLRPAGTAPPTASDLHLEGPALSAAAAAPILAYYRR